jgi:hypothetical protein
LRNISSSLSSCFAGPEQWDDPKINQLDGNACLYLKLFPELQIVKSDGEAGYAEGEKPGVI